MAQKYHVIGIMSGTSLDGLDVAFCSFEYSDKKWQYKIIKASTFIYPAIWKKRLYEASNLSALEFSLLHVEYGKFIGKTVKSFISKHKLKPDFISCHGHTIFHQPEKQLTVQIGSGAAIAAETGLTTICDFRTTDVAYMGQGAPLVPIGDHLLFADFDVCLNIGGFANLSYQKKSTRFAYDICPANIVLNYFAKKLNHEFDHNGEIARSGIRSDKLLKTLDNIAYYSLNPPKSLGKEWLETEFIPLIDKHKLSVEDCLRTLTEHIASEIAREINKSGGKTTLISGGGAFNKFLVEQIQLRCKSIIKIPSADVINYKEALIFAFLGLLRQRNEINCLKSVTGAKKDNCVGAVYMAKI